MCLASKGVLKSLATITFISPTCNGAPNLQKCPEVQQTILDLNLLANLLANLFNRGSTRNLAAGA